MKRSKKLVWSIFIAFCKDKGIYNWSYRRTFLFYQDSDDLVKLRWMEPRWWFILEELKFRVSTNISWHSCSNCTTQASTNLTGWNIISKEICTAKPVVLYRNTISRNVQLRWEYETESKRMKGKQNNRKIEKRGVL